MIKSILHFAHLSLCGVLSALLIFSCHKSSDEPEEVTADALYFVLSDWTHSASCSMAFDAAGGTQSLTLHSSGAWSASCDADWVSVPASGQAGDATFSVKAGSNADMEAQRSATVTVVSGSLSCNVSVSQGEAPGFVLSQTEFEIGSAGGSISVPVRANIEYVCTVEGDGADWISVQQTKGLNDYTIVLAISENTNPDSRTGHVDVSYEGQQSVLTVTQSQLDELILTQTSFEIGSDGGDIKVPISTNTDYTAEVIDDAGSWLSVSELRTKGLEECVLVLTAAANDGYDGRTGQVRVSGAGKQSVLTVTQSGMDSSADVEYVDLGLSVLWATCNLGATSPEELGDSYAWGETATKEEYTMDTYDPLGDGTGDYDDLGTDIAGTQYDAAYVKYGGNWRMPTQSESDELRENTTFTYTTVNGVWGALLTSIVQGYTDRSIFLPSTETNDPNSDGDGYGYYWTSTVGSWRSLRYTIVFRDNCIFDYGMAQCMSFPYQGLQIRPVCDK